MTTQDKRKQKVKKLKTQISQGVHPMQNADVNVRKKAAHRAADKMINGVLEKQK